MKLISCHKPKWNKKSMSVSKENDLKTICHLLFSKLEAIRKIKFALRKCLRYFWIGILVMWLMRWKKFWFSIRTWWHQLLYSNLIFKNMISKNDYNFFRARTFCECTFYTKLKLKSQTKKFSFNNVGNYDFYTI